MSEKIGYYNGARQAEDAMSVVAEWIANNHSLRVVYHNGTRTDADIFNAIIHIPRISGASGLTLETLMRLRSRVYHESGHIDLSKLSKSEYPKAGALFEIWNAIEDNWVESEESKKHLGCRQVFDWALRDANREIAAAVLDGNRANSLSEALVQMQIRSCGVAPAWEPAEKAARRRKKTPRCWRLGRLRR